MHKELQKVGLIVLKNGASSHFAKREARIQDFRDKIIIIYES